MVHQAFVNLARCRLSVGCSSHTWLCWERLQVIHHQAGETVQTQRAKLTVLCLRQVQDSFPSGGPPLWSSQSCCSVAQSGPTLCDSMDPRQARLSVGLPVCLRGTRNDAPSSTAFQHQRVPVPLVLLGLDCGFGLL